MSEQQNVEVVQKMYADFGNRDLPSVLNALAEDIEWRVTGASEIPFVGTSRNADQVAQFFRTLSETVEFEQFEPREFLAQGDKVVALGYERGRVKSTGRSYESNWVMEFTMRAGKVSRYCSYDDAGILKALRSD